jgi:hypothetical protein
MENIKYYEVEFGKRTDETDVFSMCIVGKRKPTIEEAEKFLASDLEMMGYDYVTEVLEIDHDEAHNFFDMERENQFPIFE